MSTQDDALAIRSNEELYELAKRIASSKIFPDAHDSARALVKIMAGREMGFPTIASMMGVYIITTKQGTTIAISATLMRAAVARHPAYRYVVKELTDEKCDLLFQERDGDKWMDLGHSVFTVRDANDADLLKRRRKDNRGNWVEVEADNWKKYRRNMLISRATSNGVKWYCPEIFGGPVYTPEELGVEVDEAGRPLKDAEIVDDSPAELEALIAKRAGGGAVGSTDADEAQADGGPGPHVDESFEVREDEAEAHPGHAPSADNGSAADGFAGLPFAERRRRTLERLKSYHEMLGPDGWSRCVDALLVGVHNPELKISERPIEELERLILMCAEAQVASD